MKRTILAAAAVAVVLALAPVGRAGPFTSYLDVVYDDMLATLQSPPGGGSLSPQQTAVIGQALQLFDRQADDLRDDLRTLRKLVKLLRKVRDVVGPGPTSNAIDDFEDHLEELAGRLREFLGPPHLSPQKEFAKAFKAMVKLDDALEDILDPDALEDRARALAKAEKKYRKLQNAIDRLYQRLEGVECDTAGPVGTPYLPGVNCRMVRIDGYPRRFIVYVPQREAGPDPDGPPAVFMFHGSSGNGGKFLRISGWRQLADREGMIVVFPTSLRYRILDNGRLSTKWHKFGLSDQVDVDERTDGYPAGAPWPADDVSFTSAMIDEIVAELDVDPTGVFVSGFSNGGAFTQRLAVELPERFTAATTVGSNIASFSTASPTPDPRIPVWQMIGEEDPKLLDAINAAEGPGTPPSPPLTAFPIDPAAFLAVSRNRLKVDRAMEVYQLEYDPHTETDFGTHSGMRWATPRAGNGDGNVFLVSVLGGVPHHYPNGPGKPRKNPHEFSAAEMSWEFFQKHWDR